MTLFSDTQVAALASKIPTELPHGHTNVLMLDYDETGAAIVVGFARDTTSGTWHVQGGYKHTKAGDNIAAGQAIYSW